MVWSSIIRKGEEMELKHGDQCQKVLKVVQPATLYNNLMFSFEVGSCHSQWKH